MPRKRRHRQRKPGRQRPFRDPRPIILVVCEGEKTEPQYLQGFKNAQRNPRVDIRIPPKHGVPRTLVEHAKQFKEEAEAAARSERDENVRYDSVWCVFDVDEHPNVANSIEMARANGIQVAVSNPCFELWLLLHFRGDPGPRQRDQIQEMLNRSVPNYRKHVEYSTYENGYTQAVNRARQLDRAAHDVNEVGRNPSTGVYKLTQSIREVDPSLE